MNVLVTGGAGYIGSHTCLALAEAGHLPVTLDNLVTGHAWAVQWGPLVKGDVRDADHVAEILTSHRIDAVLHFAALSLVGQSAQEPERYYDNNVAGTLSLLAAMQRASVRRLVFSSTCAVYGTPSVLPITEEAARNPINVYGRTKFAAENAIIAIAEAGAVDAVILRYFNAAGADPDLRIGEAHEPETHLLPLAIRAARPGAQPLAIYGKDYDTPDGTCQRDYIHVMDLAAAHLAALNYAEKSGGCLCCNLGTGQPASVRDILCAVENAAGRPVATIAAPRRRGDPAALYAANSLAREKLGWTPRHVDIADMARSALAWETARDSGARAD